MSSERGRAILIFGVVGAIAAGAGYYFFGVYRPHQVLHDAQAEVAAWEARWTSARGCLLGASPASSKTSEALAIHELAPDPWDSGACTGLMSKLVRGDAPDTGLRPVEAAWRELDHAATKAAAAFALHVDGTAHATGAASDPLPGALDALDAARHALRAAAELPPDATTAVPLPAAQQLAVLDGADPVIQLDVRGPASAHGLSVFGMTKGKRGVEVALPVGGTPRVARVLEGAARGVPDPSWAAAIEPGKLDVGAADAQGALTAPTSAPVPNLSTISAVVGTLAAGAVIYGTAGDKSTLGVARVVAGAITVEPAEEIADGFAVTDLDGRALAVWRNIEPYGYAARLVTATGGGVAIAVPMPVTEACLTGDHAWLGGEGTFFFDGKIATPRPDAAGELIGCMPDTALIRPEDDGGGVLICAQACRRAPRPSGAPEYAASTVVGGKLVAIAIHGSVLGVWRETGGPPTFYGLSTALTLVAPNRAVATDGKVIDVLARDGDNAYSVIRIPAR